MAVKKVFAELIEFLEANADKKVKTILSEATSMCEAKRSASATSYIKDKKGKVVAILDYYFKRWMPLVGEEAVEFGVKASSSTGLNTMCKEGAALFAKQLRKMKNAKAQMLEDLKSGELAVEDIAEREKEIEAEAKEIEGTELGFETKDEVIEYLEGEGVEL